MASAPPVTETPRKQSGTDAHGRRRHVQVTPVPSAAPRAPPAEHPQGPAAHAPASAEEIAGADARNCGVGPGRRSTGRPCLQRSGAAPTLVRSVLTRTLIAYPCRARRRAPPRALPPEARGTRSAPRSPCGRLYGVEAPISGPRKIDLYTQACPSTDLWSSKYSAIRSLMPRNGWHAPLRPTGVRERVFAMPLGPAQWLWPARGA